MDGSTRAGGTRLTRTFVVLSVVVLAAVGWGYQAAPARAQALPPSLQGEVFFTADTFFGSEDLDVSSTCEATLDPQTATITYHSAGIATGPYPGTYTEDGTVELTSMSLPPPFFFTGAVVDWTATFEIDSPVGQVTGTKTFSGVSGQTVCTFFDTDFGQFRLSLASGILNYEATIQPVTGGSFEDEGQAYTSVQLSEVCFGSFCEPSVEVFREDFFLSTGPLVPNPPGKATGGGQIRSVANPVAPVTFGFEVRSTGEDRLSGRCRVIDHAARTDVKCLDVTVYQQVGNTATWHGNALVNGVEEEYEITVQDNGEPNRGVDFFSIKTDSYEAAGNVEHGNIQLHKQKQFAP